MSQVCQKRKIGVPILLSFNFVSKQCDAKFCSYKFFSQKTKVQTKLRIPYFSLISGLGTTIDIVLLNGKLREGQTMVVAGTEGPIVTQIRSLLTPAKMQDLRVKVSFLGGAKLEAC